MERDAHYFTVGFFVIVTLIAGFFFTSLFVEHDRREQLPYIVHFTTPVEGLIIGSEVRFMGVRVGEVDALELLDTPPHPVRVEVKINVLEEAPLNTATVAVLRQQNLTGLSFLSLIETKSDDPPIRLITSDTQPAIIPTQLSNIDTVLTRLPDLESRLNNVLSAAENLLSPDNRRTFATILKNLEKSSAEIPQLLVSFQQTSAQLTLTAQSADRLVRNLDSELKTSASGINSTLAAIRSTASNIDVLASNVDRFIVNNEGKINKLLTQGGNDLRHLLQASRHTVNSIQKLAISLTRTSERLNLTAQQIGGAVNKVESGMNVSMGQLNQTMGAIRKTAWQLSKLVGNVDRIIVANEVQLNDLLGQGGEDFKQLLHEFRATAQQVRQLSEALEQNPSQIIYQSAPRGIELPR